MEDYCVAHTTSRRGALINLGWFAIGSSLRTVRAAQANPQGAKTHFHIDAAEATAALNEFSQQAHLMLLFDFTTLKGLKTRAINGSYTPGEALGKMLEGTGAVYAWVNERTLSVVLKAGNR